MRSIGAKLCRMLHLSLSKSCTNSADQTLRQERVIGDGLDARIVTALQGVLQQFRKSSPPTRDAA